MKYRSIIVNCRIGSLEMQAWARDGLSNVNCRIGSLEKTLQIISFRCGVICRIGSLEMQRQSTCLLALVNCRIGSLEKDYEEFYS